MYLCLINPLLLNSILYAVFFFSGAGAGCLIVFWYRGDHSYRLTGYFHAIECGLAPPNLYKNGLPAT
jgi:hypothetical protein